MYKNSKDTENIPGNYEDNIRDSSDKAWFEKDIDEWTEDDEQEAFLNISSTFFK